MEFDEEGGEIGDGLVGGHGVEAGLVVEFTQGLDGLVDAAVDALVFAVLRGEELALGLGEFDVTLVDAIGGGDEVLQLRASGEVGVVVLDPGAGAVSVVFGENAGEFPSGGAPILAAVAGLGGADDLEAVGAELFARHGEDVGDDRFLMFPAAEGAGGDEAPAARGRIGEALLGNVGADLVEELVGEQARAAGVAALRVVGRGTRVEVAGAEGRLRVVG